MSTFVVGLLLGLLIAAIAALGLGAWSVNWVWSKI